jgi:hypothetical protein
MSILIKGITPAELLRVFEWARIGANNCMIGNGVVATELPDHGDLIDRDALKEDMADKCDCETWVGIEAAIKCADSAPVVIPAERSE